MGSLAKGRCVLRQSQVDLSVGVFAKRKVCVITVTGKRVGIVSVFAKTEDTCSDNDRCKCVSVFTERLVQCAVVTITGAGVWTCLTNVWRSSDSAVER